MPGILHDFPEDICESIIPIKSLNVSDINGSGVYLNDIVWPSTQHRSSVTNKHLELIKMTMNKQLKIKKHFMEWNYSGMIIMLRNNMFRLINRWHSVLT